MSKPNNTHETVLIEAVQCSPLEHMSTRKKCWRYVLVTPPNDPCVGYFSGSRKDLDDMLSRCVTQSNYDNPEYKREHINLFKRAQKHRVNSATSVCN